MEKITITEALQEIKTVGKRIVKKREAVLRYLYRPEQLKDPHAAEGGSVEFIVQQLQGIDDLGKRVVAIRTSIQEANLANILTIQDKQRTVAVWLTWRRELAEGEGYFMKQLADKIDQVRKEAATRGLNVVGAAAIVTTTKQDDLLINIDETALNNDLEAHETVLGTLDGKLSLFNAVTYIEI